MARKNNSIQTESYLKAVAVAVGSKGKGKPQGDFITGMAKFAKEAIKEVVPANYRLSVRMAIRRKLSTVQVALAGI
jgi:hypothetical protein